MSAPATTDAPQPRLHPEFDFDFQLGRFHPDAAAELPPEELRDVAVAIGDRGSWAAELLRLGERGLAEGRPAVAAFGARAAAFYMDVGDPRRLPALRRYVELARELHGVGDAERLEVPYGDSSLPAYVLDRPDPRDTVVMFGGFDSMVEEFLGFGRILQAQGMRVVLFDGPGQGSALEERGLRMTPEWHRPVAAVLDHLDLSGVTLFGISLGGCLAIRAAACEPRIARVVCDDVMSSLADCMLAQVPPRLRALQRATRRLPAPLTDPLAARLTRSALVASWGRGQAEHVFGVRGTAAIMREAARYVTAPLSPQVTQDVLLFAGRDDHYVPGDQLTEQLGTLRAARSVTTHLLTAADRAGTHCHTGNYALPLELTLAWLASLEARRDLAPAG